MKILLLSPNQITKKNWTHQLFRNEIGKHHDVTYYGEGYPNFEPNKPIPELVKGKGYDLILTYGMKYTEPFIGIGDIKDIVKAHIIVDYFPDATSGTYERNHRLFRRDNYDVYFGVVGDIVRNLFKNKVTTKAFLLPFSIDTNLYKKIEQPKVYDVMAVYTLRSDTYPLRNRVQRLVSSLHDLKTYTGKAKHRTYIDVINKSRICLTSNNKFKSLSIKYTEFLSCGSFMMADKPEDFSELGYIDGEHLVLYNDLRDLQSKIYYYLKNYKEREKIANQGMEFVRKNHSNEVRVKQMTEILNKEFGLK